MAAAASSFGKGCNVYFEISHGAGDEVEQLLQKVEQTSHH